jgi:23S rRNA pseudouridine2605 synthase
MRLNKFVAHAGVDSRRKCAEYIKAGKVEVNGKVEINPSYMVADDDVVTYGGKVLKHQINLVHILMNKPKNTITTTSDEHGRPTVIDLVKEKYDRLYPVGRLDKDTTGLLILTNDGDLAQKLAHPSFEIKKVYSATLDQDINEQHLEKIRNGLLLSDGVAEVDSVDYADGNNKNVVGITLHIGKNRIVRRIFDHLGYEVLKLDRIYYAGLTKKDLPRGRYRHLTDMEVKRLKHFNKL